nr:reverse transcriptase domain-containing protein [Tanacetum cinerariifolium]
GSEGYYTRSGTAYQGPTIPTNSSSIPLVVERKTEETKDMVQPTNNESTKDVQPPVVQTKSLILNSELVVASIIEPVASPVSAQKPNQRPSIPYPSRFHDFDADPRVPLILRRSFLKTRRALIDVFEGELTLRVGKEAITFNLDQTLRYSANYNDMTANRIDVIDMACEEYSQEVLGFFNSIASGNPTPYYESIISTNSPTLTPFGNSDFLLEEADAFLALEDDPILRVLMQCYKLWIWLGFKALTRAATGSMVGATTGSEFKIRDSVWTTRGWTSLVLLLSYFELVIVLPGRVPEPEDEASHFKVKESGVDEPELGKPELDKLVLDKLKVGFDHVKLLGRIGSFLGCFPEDYGFLDSCFGYGSSDFDSYDFDSG